MTGKERFPTVFLTKAKKSDAGIEIGICKSMTASITTGTVEVKKRKKQITYYYHQITYLLTNKFQTHM